jgi:hypothetical protein
MIIELITPLMLATSPMAITELEPFKYSHEKQAVDAPTVVAQRMTTFGGTRTYDYRGQPWDNDND